MESVGGARAQDTARGFGARLRAERERHHLSLRALAKRVGVSASLISQIETGKARPSVNTLYAIATELGVSVDDLLFTDANGNGRPSASASVASAAVGSAAVASPPAADNTAGPSAASVERWFAGQGESAVGDEVPGGAQVRDLRSVMPLPPIPLLQRHEGRKVIQFGSGVRWERLTSASMPGVDFLYVVYEPGGSSSDEGAFQRHAGHEWGYVTRGALHVTVGFDDYDLHPGDAITFDSTIPHRMHNAGSEPVHGIWFVLGRHA